MLLFPTESTSFNNIGSSFFFVPFLKFQFKLSIIRSRASFLPLNVIALFQHRFYVFFSSTCPFALVLLLRYSFSSYQTMHIFTPRQPYQSMVIPILTPIFRYFFLFHYFLICTCPRQTLLAMLLHFHLVDEVQGFLTADQISCFFIHFFYIACSVIKRDLRQR